MRAAVGRRFARSARGTRDAQSALSEELALARSANPFALPEDAHLWASVAREKVQTRGYRALVSVVGSPHFL
jgi:hypothetical protein